jgi:ferredoxin--NADP+ reductase
MTSASPIAGPELPEARMHIYKPTGPFTATVVRNDVCTAGRKAAGFVRHLEFDVSGSDLVGACLPGQAIGVVAPGVDAAGKPHKLRLYSLCSPAAGEDGNPARIATTVKRTIDEHWETHRLFLGVASNYLCDLQPGDPVALTGPAGKKFLLPRDTSAHDYVFVATGTGIAPFRGMILELLATNTASAITLVMGSPYRTDLIYDDLFTRLAGEHPRFRYLTAVSREPQRDGGAPMYVQDRLAAEYETVGPMLRSDRTLVYICGVAGMEVGVFQALARMLQGTSLEAYLTGEASVLADPTAWTRKMIHREVCPTRRVLLEVYD